jgi:ABC-type branched-subunit amino acid transport system ATPase component
MSILELRSITKTFDGLRAVDDLTIGFEKGRITALIGPNGAGKTTVFNLINGLILPDCGEIYYKNRNIVGLKPWEIANLGIGRLFQDVRVFGRMKVIDNVLCAFKNQKGEIFYHPILSVWKVRKEERIYREKALELLDFVGLIDKKEDIAENLSYGQQKLLAIARLLANDADLFLLDEPTAGVNPKMIEKLLELIRRLSFQGKTIIIIEHNMNVVIKIADWVYFMSNGQVTSFGLPQDVLGDPEVRRAYIGI